MMGLLACVPPSATTTTVMGRKKASPEATSRRQLARAARRAAEQARLKKEQAIADRMFKRFYHNSQPINLILLDYRYWQARRCGWDVMRAEVNGGDPPNDCWIWHWWTRLRWDTREDVVALSRWIRTGVRR